MADLITNMTSGGRQRRLLMGIIMLVVAAALGVGLVAEGAGRAWRLALFVPLWVAGLGLFQVRERTECGWPRAGRARPIRAWLA